MTKSYTKHEHKCIDCGEKWLDERERNCLCGMKSYPSCPIHERPKEEGGCAGCELWGRKKCGYHNPQPKEECEHIGRNYGIKATKCIDCGHLEEDNFKSPQPKEECKKMNHKPGWGCSDCPGMKPKKINPLRKNEIIRLHKLGLCDTARKIEELINKGITG